MKECTREDKQTKYNYVLYNVNEDYLKPYFFPLKNKKNVKVYEQAFDGSRLLQKLFFLHWSARLNRRITLPLKNIWFRKMCKKDFPDEKPCCYVFIGSKYLNQDQRLFQYIKKLNPQNKACFYFLDLLSKRNKDIEPYKKCSDFALTYDRGEAEKFQIHCFDELIYGAITDTTEPDEFEWDVYFLGFAKDRLDRIHRVYQRLSEAGLRCKFIICGSKPEERISGKGLLYQEPISYLENLENVKKSRCILELMQGGSDAPTLRTQEAITYKRKLLTDYTSVLGLPYYNDSFMSVFRKPEEIDTEFATAPIDYSAFESTYDLSPEKLISFLEKILE